jgi:predicted RNA binding protein YcfA (HicA-like mRNA interferase family)
MTPKFPSMSSKEIVRMLHEAGFVEDRQKGSHLILKHHEKHLRATVPVGKKDLPIGTAKAILKEVKIDVSGL